MSKILYLTYTGITEPLGQSQVLAYLVEIASKTKFSFDVLSFETPDFQQNQQKVASLCKAHNIGWYSLPYSIGNSVKDIFYRPRAMKAKILELQKLNNYDIVHCRSYRAAEIGLWMKKKFGVKLIFDMRGFWADERIEGNIWKLSNPLHKQLYNHYKRLEKKLLIDSDAIVSLTDNAADIIQNWKLRSHPLYITVIPCCADVNHFVPSQMPEDIVDIKQQLAIPQQDKVITYLGSLGSWYLLDEMMAFFAAFQRKHPETTLFFISGEKPENILNSAKKYNVPENKIVIQKASREQVPLFLSVSDYSLFFIKPSFSKSASSPVKQGEIMAMGIPAICNEGVGDTSRVINKYKSGFLINSLDPASFPGQIDDLLHANFDRKTIRDGAVDFYSLEKGAELYTGVYETLSN